MRGSAGVMLALDLDRREEALAVVKELGPAAAGYKVGSQLFSRCGPEIVDAIRALRGEVFLDLKFHDIPNTVGKAVEATVSRGVSWLTVHASGGTGMIEAAVAAAGAVRVLAVTVLTSMTAEEARRIGIASLEEQVLRLAVLAREAGAHGIVCSPLEVARLRRELGPECLLVAPGIRPAASSLDDQARVSTPAEAVRAGADYLVVGRPVLAAKDRRKAMEGILREMAGHRKV